MPEKKPKSTAERQAERNLRILKAGLVQRKVVGHPDDFDEIRNFARQLYEKRNISI